VRVGIQREIRGRADCVSRCGGSGPAGQFATNWQATIASRRE